DEPSDDNGDRTEQVSQHLEVGAAYVDTLLLPRLQDQEGDEVSHRTDDRCYKHRSCLDLYLGSDAPDRIDDDNDTDDAEDDAIEHRGEHLDSHEPVGAFRSRRKRGDEGRYEGDEHTCGIGEHMSCVGEQCERSGYERTDDLDEEDQRRDGEDEDELLAVLAARGCMSLESVVVAMTVTAGYLSLRAGGVSFTEGELDAVVMVVVMRRCHVFTIARL